MSICTVISKLLWNTQTMDYLVGALSWRQWKEKPPWHGGQQSKLKQGKPLTSGWDCLLLLRSSRFCLMFHACQYCPSRPRTGGLPYFGCCIAHNAMETFFQLPPGERPHEISYGSRVSDKFADDCTLYIVHAICGNIFLRSPSPESIGE